MRLVTNPSAGLIAVAVTLALAAAGCAAPSAEKSASGAAGQIAAKGEPGKATGKKKLPWWRLSQYSRGPAFETREERYRKRPGLFSGKDGEFVLYREGEADSSNSTKPSKVRR